MDFRILDFDFNPVDTLDKFESIIWSSRFLEAGDFELYTPVDQRILDDVRIGYYLFCDTFYNPTTDEADLMIIETMEITSDPQNGNKIRILGRNLKSLLDRRIIWGQVAFKTSDMVSSVITTLLNDNAINPPDWSKQYQDGGTGQYITVSVTGEQRKLPNLVYEEGEFEDVAIDGDYQYNGETLYDTFVDMLGRFNLGWEVLYNFTTGKYVFRIKGEIDHTYNQNERNPLVFSPSFENLKNSNYIESSSTEKNSGLITGEGDENNVMYNVVGDKYTKAKPTGEENPKALGWYEKTNDGYILTNDITVDVTKTYYMHSIYSGLERKEMNISASDISRKKDDGTEYGNRTYLGMLLTKGENELAQNIYTQTYEGTAEATRGYVYLEDYNIGDICEIVNEWGISSMVLISEVVMSVSVNEVSTIPTFAAIEQNSEEVST